MTEDDKKAYTVKQKMYLGKLDDNSIKAPKEETLKYYNIFKDGEEYKIRSD